MEVVFNRHRPDIIVVDNFYKDPDIISSPLAVGKFKEVPNHYKGLRSRPHLMPFVKEEFERLLGVQITDWMDQPYNGCFQLTKASDPLVWHSDTQDYAAAVYLTKDAEDMGTSFWKHIQTGHRLPPSTNEECAEVYSEYNLTHPDNWKLIDKVGAVYNRLVIWNAKMIHSASEYSSDKDRLVQLFFFSVR
jgi:hypothetical protein